MAGKLTQTAFVGGKVPAALKKSLNEIAVKNDRSESAELRQALREYVEAHKREAAA